MWRRKGSSLQSYVISELLLDTAGLLEMFVVSLWRKEKPCFGVAKTGTDFLHARLFDLLTAELFSIIHQGWCRACHESNWLYGAKDLRKAWKKDFNTNLGSHFSHENVCIIRQICQCWLLCSICPRNCLGKYCTSSATCALLRLCPTPAIPEMRYFFLAYVISAEGSDWLRCGNPPLEAGDLLSLVVLLPSIPAVMLVFLGPCVTKGGSHCWERTWASKVFLL